MTRDRSFIHTIHIPLTMGIDGTTSYFCAEPVPTLIDVPPHNGPAEKHLEASLVAMGYSIGDIGRIIVTHPHLDHFGSAAWIRERSGAEVWILKGGAKRLERSHEEIEKDFQYYCRFLDWSGAPNPGEAYLADFFEAAKGYAPPVEVAKYLEEGEEIEIGSSRFTVIHVPGHTPWCTLFYDSDSSTGFTGDFLIGDIKSNAVVRRPEEGRERYRSLGAYLSSLRKIKDLGLKKAFPGHGDAIEDAQARIDEVVSFILKRQQQVLSILKEGPATPYGIMDRIFPNLPRFHVLLGISEIVGHLEVLEDEGRVRRDKGTAVYRG